MQDITHSLNPGAPEVLQSQHPHYKSMVLKNGLFHGSDSSMTDHVQSQAAASGSGGTDNSWPAVLEKMFQEEFSSAPQHLGREEAEKHTPGKGRS